MTSLFFVEFYSLKKYDTHDEPRIFIDRDYPTVYTCDGHNGTLPEQRNASARRGTFTFNGYYRVENHPPPYPEDEQLEVYNRPYRHVHYLPQTLCMYVKSNTTTEEHYYVVEIYKREIHKNTNSYSTINDEDGSEMHVCFFPTDEQTLHFKILETWK